jgi:hypothetical protein
MVESATPTSAGSTVAGATGAASVKTVKVVLPLTSEQRLEALRKGLQVERQGLVIQVPITSQALDGVDADGEGYLKESESFNVELDYTAFVLAGKTVDDAYTDYLQRLAKYKQEKEEEERKQKEEQRKLAEKQAIIKQAILAKFPNVTVDEENKWGYERLTVSYTSGKTNDKMDIYINDTITVERALNYVQELVKSVEEREEERKKKEAKKEAEEREKAEWIQAHGSQHLREAFARGYDCQRMYITERVAKELPGYIVYKFDGRDEWELYDRSCPSVEALEEVKRMEKLGFHPVVKWAKLAPSDEDDGGQAEIVYLEDFHGYEVYKIIHFEEEDDDC